MQVARSAEAQPEETDPAKASSDNLKLHGQNPSIYHKAPPHTLCFVPSDVNCATIVAAWCVEGPHTDTDCKYVDDIGGLWADILDDGSFDRGDEK